MLNFKKTILFTAAIACAFVRPAYADFLEQDYLLGDWGGKRAELEERGLSVESILTLDEIGNVAGGAKRDNAFLGNYDLTFTVDSEKVGLWQGGTLFVYVLGNFGEPPSSFVGDLQVTDNIETTETIKLYEAWYEQSVFDGNVSLLVGLHDYNSEFYALEHAGNLLNSSFGVGADAAQAGPSIFAYTSLAARLKVKPSENLYVMGAVYDGVPGDPNHPRGTRVNFRSDDGLFYAAEGGYAGGEGADYVKTGLGLWFHTKEFEDFNGNMQDNNNGLYVIGEKTLFTEEGSDDQGLGVFLQLGFAREARNQISQYFGGGFSYTGALPGRDKDIVSVGVARAEIGNDYREAAPESVSAETTIEANYHAQLTPFFALTPDVQWVIDPGAVRGVSDALVIGMRAEIAM